MIMNQEFVNTAILVSYIMGFVIGWISYRLMDGKITGGRRTKASKPQRHQEAFDVLRVPSETKPEYYVKCSYFRKVDGKKQRVKGYIRRRPSPMETKPKEAGK